MLLSRYQVISLPWGLTLRYAEMMQRLQRYPLKIFTAMYSKKCILELRFLTHWTHNSKILENHRYIHFTCYMIHTDLNSHWLQYFNALHSVFSTFWLIKMSVCHITRLRPILILTLRFLPHIATTKHRPRIITSSSWYLV